MIDKHHTHTDQTHPFFLQRLQAGIQFLNTSLSLTTQLFNLLPQCLKLGQGTRQQVLKQSPYTEQQHTYLDHTASSKTTTARQQSLFGRSAQHQFQDKLKQIMSTLIAMDQLFPMEKKSASR